MSQNLKYLQCFEYIKKLCVSKANDSKIVSKKIANDNIKYSEDISDVLDNFKCLKNWLMIILNVSKAKVTKIVHLKNSQYS